MNTQHLNQSTYAAEQARAHRAQQNHIKHTPPEPIPQFDKESAEALVCQYSKPDTPILSPARQELAGLIADRNAAETVVTAKKSALSKAQQLCTNLRLDLDAVRKSAASSADAQAAALVRCFESGDEPPPAAQPVVTGNADALAQQLEVATAARDQLQNDQIVADAELAKLQEQVKQGAFAVMRNDGDAIASEIESLQELIDQKRTMLSALGTSAVKYTKIMNNVGAVDRPQLLTARSQSALCDAPAKQYSPGTDPMTKALPRWHAYHAALCLNACATFEDS